tara:strand:- start:2254 stop:2388 length:135 start_codon:yes stop_codon:yes gene_type:complete
MEFEELAKILFFVALLLILIYLVMGLWGKHIDIFGKIKDLILFR